MVRGNAKAGGGPAAVGWRTHSGWAVVVVMAGTPAEPVVLVRRRAELLDQDLPRQPYHAAAEGGLRLDEGAALIRQVAVAATAGAGAALASVVSELAGSEHELVGVGLVAAERRIPPSLDQILASHALLHGAEGELYEQAVAEAAARAHLPLSVLSSKTVFSDAAAAVVTDSATLEAALRIVGRAIGPPWQKDHREAAAAALTALYATDAPA